MDESPPLTAKRLSSVNSKSSSGFDVDSLGSSCHSSLEGHQHEPLSTSAFHRWSGYADPDTNLAFKSRYFPRWWLLTLCWLCVLFWSFPTQYGGGFQELSTIRQIAIHLQTAQYTICAIAEPLRHFAEKRKYISVSFSKWLQETVTLWSVFLLCESTFLYDVSNSEACDRNTDSSLGGVQRFNFCYRTQSLGLTPLVVMLQAFSFRASRILLVGVGFFLTAMAVEIANANSSISSTSRPGYVFLIVSVLSAITFHRENLMCLEFEMTMTLRKKMNLLVTQFDRDMSLVRNLGGQLLHDEGTRVSTSLCTLVLVKLQPDVGRSHTPRAIAAHFDRLATRADELGKKYGVHFLGQSEELYLAGAGFGSFGATDDQLSPPSLLSEEDHDPSEVLDFAFDLSDAFPSSKLVVSCGPLNGIFKRERFTFLGEGSAFSDVFQGMREIRDTSITGNGVFGTPALKERLGAGAFPSLPSDHTMHLRFGTRRFLSQLLAAREERKGERISAQLSGEGPSSTILDAMEKASYVQQRDLVLVRMQRPQRDTFHPTFATEAATERTDAVEERDFPSDIGTNSVTGLGNSLVQRARVSSSARGLLVLGQDISQYNTDALEDEPPHLRRLTEAEDEVWSDYYQARHQAKETWKVWFLFPINRPDYWIFASNVAFSSAPIAASTMFAVTVSLAVIATAEGSLNHSAVILFAADLLLIAAGFPLRYLLSTRSKPSPSASAASADSPPTDRSASEETQSADEPQRDTLSPTSSESRASPAFETSQPALRRYYVFVEAGLVLLHSILLVRAILSLNVSVLNNRLSYLVTLVSLVPCHYSLWIPVAAMTLTLLQCLLYLKDEHSARLPEELLHMLLTPLLVPYLGLTERVLRRDHAASRCLSPLSKVVTLRAGRVAETLKLLLPSFIVEHVEFKRSTVWDCVADTVGDIAVLHGQMSPCLSLEQQEVFFRKVHVGIREHLSAASDVLEVLSWVGDRFAVGGPLLTPTKSGQLPLDSTRVLRRRTEEANANEAARLLVRLLRSLVPQSTNPPAGGNSQTTSSDSYGREPSAPEQSFSSNSSSTLGDSSRTSGLGFTAILHRSDGLTVVLGPTRPRYCLLGSITATTGPLLTAAVENSIHMTFPFYNLADAETFSHGAKVTPLSHSWATTQAGVVKMYKLEL